MLLLLFRAAAAHEMGANEIAPLGLEVRTGSRVAARKGARKRLKLRLKLELELELELKLRRRQGIVRPI